MSAHCFIYRRVSTSEQVDSGLGLEAQLSSCEAYANKQGYVVREVFTDGGVSGAAPLSQRPALTALFSALPPKEPSIILVAKRDRLGRDVLLMQLFEAELLRRGARVESAAGEGNGDEPADKLMRTIIDAFGSFERDLIRARTKEALAKKKSRNERGPGSIPYGTKLAADGVHLQLEPTEVKTIQLVRSMAASGLSYRQISKKLVELGRFSRKGTRFHQQQLKRMVDL